MKEDEIIEKLDSLKSQLDTIEDLLRAKRVSSGHKENVQKNHESIRSKSESESPKQYKGIVGGIQYLIDNNFLNHLHSMREIYEELKKEGYFYRLEAVDTILRRDFVMKKKILVRTQEDGVWKYIIRK